MITKIMIYKKLFSSIGIFIFVFAISFFASAQDFEEFESYFERAYVLNVIEEEKTSDGSPVQIAEIKLLTGPNADEIIKIKNVTLPKRDDMIMKVGQKVVVQRVEREDGTNQYYFREIYRLNSLLWIAIFFIALTAFIGKKKGIMALIGLCISLGIILFVMFPLIVSGLPAFGVSILGVFLIACSTIFIAHGFNWRSILALIATCATLVFAIAFSALAVFMSNLFGLGTEESVFLQLDPSLAIDPKGLLLAGIIIGALGVLDDITTTQIAAVDEVRKANIYYGFKKLYKAGLSVGHEHIASMINTLALAYIGASLPMFLLISFDSVSPVWVTLNSAFFAEEIVRTLVGSAALLVAVPLSTGLAALFFTRKEKSSSY